MDIDIDALKRIRDILVRNEKTLAVAESVTSGLIQFCFASVPDASQFFQGGITAYNLGQKCRHLSINAVHAMKCDCVSEKTAREMALHVIPLFACDYGIAITGFASISPEQNDELYAWFAIAEKDNVLLSKRIKSSKPEGDDTQWYFAKQAVSAFLGVLEDNEKGNSK